MEWWKRMTPNLAEIVGHFRFAGDFLAAELCAAGHINVTYIVYFGMPNGTRSRYIMQKINHRVFRAPEKLMRNIEDVTGHLGQKILAAGGEPQRETLSLIPTLDGGGFYRTSGDEYWRAYLFIEGAQTYQIVESPARMYNAGKAFGRFQRLLGDFPVETLHETIVDFHHTPKRYKAFILAVEKDGQGRARSAAAEIAFVRARAAETPVLIDLAAAGRLPARVTHNDTKINNVMFDDATGEGICVIDLDTVMPGLAPYDFGDSIRSGANTAAEDERDLAKVRFDLALYESYTRGFLEETGGFLTAEEIELLPFAAKLMTLECGMRFLADHLNGDVYFRIHREGHNLDRARTQFKMVAEMEKNFEAMGEIVRKYKDAI
jgi:Ser/Thr protein kinase RdoA (MazF antagonist)